MTLSLNIKPESVRVKPLYREKWTDAEANAFARTGAVRSAKPAAFVEQNRGSPATIDALVKQGYLVRTRADEPHQGRALSTGARMLSTDGLKARLKGLAGGGLIHADNMHHLEAGSIERFEGLELDLLRQLCFAGASRRDSCCESRQVNLVRWTCAS